MPRVRISSLPRDAWNEECLLYPDMALLKLVSVENFGGFQYKIEIPLGQSTYLIWTNNSWKTTALKALRVFFDDLPVAVELFNVSRLKGKKAGANIMNIWILLDIDLIQVVAARQRLKKIFTEWFVRIEKTFKYVESSNEVVLEKTTVNGAALDKEQEWHADLIKILYWIAITYIHPQEGEELLIRAQHKLKERLLSRWWQHKKMSSELKRLQTDWANVTDKASKSLASSLNSSIAEIWNWAEVKIDFPDSVDDLIAISGISFRETEDGPWIDLASQWTGAQSVTLYHAHFLLDNDRSLHRWQHYYPIWLLEEPESFLHADLCVKLWMQLNSSEWFHRVQVVASTHSPLILASSNGGTQVSEVIWNKMGNMTIELSKPVQYWSFDEIDELGTMMGDVNFSSYFNLTSASVWKVNVYVEDKIDSSVNTWIRSINDTNICIKSAEDGASWINKLMKVLKVFPEFRVWTYCFVVDNDKWKQHIKPFPSVLLSENGWIKKYEICENVSLILLKEGQALEDLFDEFDDFVVSEVLPQIYWLEAKEQMTLPENIPAKFSQICSRLKKPNMDLSDIKSELKKADEVKTEFWKTVESRTLVFSESNVSTLKGLILPDDWAHA